MSAQPTAFRADRLRTDEEHLERVADAVEELVEVAGCNAETVLETLAARRGFRLVRAVLVEESEPEPWTVA